MQLPALGHLSVALEFHAWPLACLIIAPARHLQSMNHYVRGQIISETHTYLGRHEYNRAYGTEPSLSVPRWMISYFTCLIWCLNNSYHPVSHWLSSPHSLGRGGHGPPLPCPIRERNVPAVRAAGLSTDILHRNSQLSVSTVARY